MYNQIYYPHPWSNPMYSNGGHYMNQYDAYVTYSNEYPYYRNVSIQDFGPNPYVVNIEKATKQNQTYRTALWTGRHLQVTLMSIPVGDDIGLEVHPTTDQFIRIEEGQGLVRMGDSKDRVDFEHMAYKDFAIMVPAGKWHNVINTGHAPLKVYVIYAPPEHPYGTVHPTKAEAMAAE